MVLKNDSICHRNQQIWSREPVLLARMWNQFLDYQGFKTQLVNCWRVWRILHSKQNYAKTRVLTLKKKLEYNFKIYIVSTSSEVNQNWVILQIKTTFYYYCWNESLMPGHQTLCYFLSTNTYLQFDRFDLTSKL